MKKHFAVILVLALGVLHTYFFAYHEWIFEGVSWILQLLTSIYHGIGDFLISPSDWIREHPVIKNVALFVLLWVLLMLMGGLADSHG